MFEILLLLLFIAICACFYFGYYFVSFWLVVAAAIVALIGAMWNPIFFIFMVLFIMVAVYIRVKDFIGLEKRKKEELKNAINKEEDKVKKDLDIK